ncbi:MAG: acetylornithine deacetylase [Pyrinomonadaceae bacterium]|nr:acetylornithine deacetylase [Pyrinomonadaceae bacterium]MBA3570660.1 acetylornithine deacetylase [Pyrinomonadaceae bacterium]
MTAKETLAQLVNIDSVSSRSNAEIISLLTSRCQALGLCVKHFPYADENGVEKINMVALAGTDFSDATSVELALVGHTDTVPYDPDWAEATTLIEREGKLFARGACDTKGFIAAALTSAAGIDLKRLRKPLALIFTADEEVGLFGAKRLAEARPLQARYSIVGEPTSLQPMHAGKGYCLAEVIVRGREGHSAYPALGASAIFRAARVIVRIEKIAEDLKAGRHESFDPPYTTLNIGMIRGGTAKNVIAGECRFTLEWRPIPGQPSNRLLDLLQMALEEEKKLDPGFECEVIASRADSGFEVPADSQIIKLLERLSGEKTGTVAFGTEAAQMIELGADAVVMGPGNIRVAHQTGEFVPIDELDRCVEILRQAIEFSCL